MGSATTADIVLLPGDGVGPEVMAEATKVLAAVGERWGHRFTTETALLGGAAIDVHGVPLRDEEIERCRTADALLLGAVGGPKWDAVERARRPERGLLRLRKSLGLFANLRPTTVMPALLDACPLRPERAAGTDLLIVRELTGGGADYAFDAFGSARTVQQAFECIRNGGAAVEVGIAPQGQMAQIDAYSLAMHEKTLKGSFYGSARPRVDMLRLLDLYGQGRLKLDELVARTYRLDQINEAYAALQAGAVARGVIVF